MSKPHFRGVYVIDMIEPLAAKENDIANTQGPKIVFLSLSVKAAYSSKEIINPRLAKPPKQIMEE